MGLSNLGLDVANELVKSDAPPAPWQVAWAFLHRGDTPLAKFEPYDLRQRALKRWASWPHLEVSVRSCKGATTLVARTPEASSWLASHMGEVMQLVADVAGRPIAVDARQQRPGVSFRGRHLHYIRNFIVARARKSAPWDEWRTEDLSAEKREELARMIGKGVSEELRRWSALGEANSVGGVIITNVGRPMPIVPNSGPRGLARIGVSFIAPWAIDGEMFVGEHTLLGNGLVRRGGEVRSSTLQAVELGIGQQQAGAV